MRHSWIHIGAIQLQQWEERTLSLPTAHQHMYSGDVLHNIGTWPNTLGQNANYTAGTTNHSCVTKHKYMSSGRHVTHMIDDYSLVRIPGGRKHRTRECNKNYK